MIPTILGIMFISFVIVQFAPGGPVERIAGVGGRIPTVLGDPARRAFEVREVRRQRRFAQTQIDRRRLLARVDLANQRTRESPLTADSYGDGVLAQHRVQRGLPIGRVVALADDQRARRSELAGRETLGHAFPESRPRARERALGRHGLARRARRRSACCGEHDARAETPPRARRARPSTTMQREPTNAPSSTITGCACGGSSTPPMPTPPERCTFLPICAHEPTVAQVSIIVPSSTYAPMLTYPGIKIDAAPEKASVTSDARRHAAHAELLIVALDRKLVEVRRRMRAAPRVAASRRPAAISAASKRWKYRRIACLTHACVTHSPSIGSATRSSPSSSSRDHVVDDSSGRLRATAARAAICSSSIRARA